jgi:Tfp pilus assembly protein PilX
MNTRPPTLHRNAGVARQRGIVMLFGMIALAIMLIGAVAMVRSMNTSMFNLGNLGFKRDITNQAERAVASAMTALNTGTLASVAARQSPNVSANYSATILATNTQGLPTALVDDLVFTTIGSTSNDISISSQGITVRYVIDRMCVNTGTATQSHCTMSGNAVPDGGTSGSDPRAEDSSSGGAGAVGQQTVYRVSVRVTGPRRTQAYFQTTLTL